MWRHTVAEITAADSGRREGRWRGWIVLLLLALAVGLFGVGHDYLDKPMAGASDVVTRPNPELGAL